ADGAGSRGPAALHPVPPRHGAPVTARVRGRLPLSASESVTPQPPGRTPHKAPQAPLRCPGGEDTPPEASEAPAREAMNMSVALAAATPDRLQPYRELGLTAEEDQRIRDLLGRRPTDPELALYSVMWSEHCSYKSSRRHLRQFADKAPRTAALLAGIGHNAGVVDIGQGYAVTFKIESHNHPSYVEPF